MMIVFSTVAPEMVTTASDLTARLLTASYLFAAVLFIFSLSGLSNQETARRGNLFGIIGMTLAVLAALAWNDGVTAPKLGGIALSTISLFVGGLIGLGLAIRVAMTSMPELTAALHSFVGLAAVLVGLSTYYGSANINGHPFEVVHLIEIYIDVAIGAITFTGSVVAYLKLAGKMSGKPLLLPGRHALNALVALSIVGMCVGFAWLQTGSEDIDATAQILLLVMTVLASLLGVHLVAAIGGADMPVVVSMLNSYSGWTAAAAGFMLQNDLLIVTGALVGSSGAILSYIMCKAMNRSIWNVIFGGFGTVAVKPKAGGGEQVAGEVQPIDADELSDILKGSKEVIIVPGYGMAVAQAQHPVKDFTDLLKGMGVNVRYGIHPVAGRLPGHMNVLLAEAGVPYDIVLEMDELNDDFPATDVVLVIGANDIVNPGALDDESSPIYGMPVLHAWEATTTVVLKRSMNVGYAGVANPLFFKDNTRMLFGDAKDSMQALCAAIRS